MERYKIMDNSEFVCGRSRKRRINRAKRGYCDTRERVCKFAKFKMLLPLNATKQEKALVDAMDYKVDPSCIRGFKFRLEERILPWLIEEYELGEILRWVKDRRKAIVEGVKFQRLRGPSITQNSTKMGKYRRYYNH